MPGLTLFYMRKLELLNKVLSPPISVCLSGLTYVPAERARGCVGGGGGLLVAERMKVGILAGERVWAQAPALRRGGPGHQRQHVAGRGWDLFTSLILPVPMVT